MPPIPHRRAPPSSGQSSNSNSIKLIQDHANKIVGEVKKYQSRAKLSRQASSTSINSYRSRRPTSAYSLKQRAQSRESKNSGSEVELSKCLID